MKKKIPLRQRAWYKLDNAAKLFPALNFNNQTSYFRLEAYLKEDVSATILSSALTYALERFPTFSIKRIFVPAGTAVSNTAEICCAVK